MGSGVGNREKKHFHVYIETEKENRRKVLIWNTAFIIYKILIYANKKKKVEE